MKRKRNSPEKGYFEIEIEESDAVMIGADLWNLFNMKDLAERKLFLNEAVTELSANELTHHIMQYNREDKNIPVEERQPIMLYVSSDGGEVDAGFSIIDVIKASITPIHTVNVGGAYSMAFLIMLAGNKRYSFPNAKFLMHDGSNFIYNSGAKARDEMEFQCRVEERIKSYVLENSKLTEKEYDESFRKEWYMFADEAVKYGFVDKIVGRDEEIDSIV